MASGAFQPGTGVAPATLVELSVSCRKLIDADVFSKSDPMCVLFTQDQSKNWKEFGRTEIIWNNLNPDFVKKFVMHYYFEQSQKLKFEVYDVDSKSADLSKHDFLGRMECTLGEIVSAGSKFMRRLV
ncbi:copine-5-like [Saccostrea cucullata]